MDTVARELIKISILGPILVACGYWILRLQRELERVQEKRTADANATLEKVLELNDKWNAAIGATDAALDSQRELLAEIKDSLRDLARVRP